VAQNITTVAMLSRTQWRNANELLSSVGLSRHSAKRYLMTGRVSCRFAPPGSRSITVLMKFGAPAMDVTVVAKSEIESTRHVRDRYLPVDVP
jgi:hypothetical protein